ncbi:MAG: oligosaccharide flippase family protein [Deltaproteobacteria bacterium]
MREYIKNNIDAFSKNIILVFAGTSLVNLFNLLCQLLIAHRLTPADFAAFNSLIAIMLFVSAPLSTIQTATAKYAAEFNANNLPDNVKALLSGLFKKSLIFSLLTFLIVYLFSFYLLDKLRISSAYSGCILALLLAVSWLSPVFTGALQGLELFKWLTSVSVIGGFAKLIFAVIFIQLGFNVAGALGAIAAGVLITLIISVYPVRKMISFNAVPVEMNFQEIFVYLFPVAISTFCFTALTNMDMVLVKYYFNPQDSGAYSLAQMAGKIFLFLPTSISIVMFPKTSSLNAQNLDTAVIVRRSLIYTALLCVLSGAVYNCMPSFILKILTGKAFPESILLGRMFSVSMSFFSLLFVLVTYFLSIKDLRFLKYLVLFSALQVLAIALFHQHLIQIQWILCANAIFVFFIHLALFKSKK